MLMQIVRFAIMGGTIVVCLREKTPMPNTLSVFQMTREKSSSRETFDFNCNLEGLKEGNWALSKVKTKSYEKQGFLSSNSSKTQASKFTKVRFEEESNRFYI